MNLLDLFLNLHLTAPPISNLSDSTRDILLEILVDIGE